MAAPAETGVPRPARRRRRWVVLAAVLGGLGVLALGAGFLTLPYFAVGPGDARAVDDLVSVRHARRYPPRGKVLFTTVSLGRVNAYEALAGWLDDDVDVVPERTLLGGESRRQFRRQNLRDMSDSKQTAAYVALRRLGFPVTIQGDGAEVVEEPKRGAPARGLVHPGDVIVRVDERPVTTAEDLGTAVRAHRAGDTVTFEVKGQGNAVPRRVSARLAAREDGAALLGVITQTKDQRFDSPVELDIDSGQVGGPSAGLAFTLAVLDVLTPGELTGGMPVAVTGTIDLDGKVGPVGGVAQKTATVRRTGAELFLVPSDEYTEAKRRAGKDLQVVKVDSLDEALRALSRRTGSNALALGRPGRRS